MYILTKLQLWYFPKKMETTCYMTIYFSTYFWKYDFSYNYFFHFEAEIASIEF